MAIGNDGRSDSSHLGKTFQFKGDITGTEDIYIDGKVEGSIQLPGQSVTVGQHGDVSAAIESRELIVHGKVKGNARAADRIEVTRTGSVVGDLAMTRISIQDGAFMQGRVDISQVSGTPSGAATAPARAPLAASATPGGPQQSQPAHQASLLGERK